MKNQKPSLSKFRIAKLNRPEYIIGGSGLNDGDDGTVGERDKDKCHLNSRIIL